MSKTIALRQVRHGEIFELDGVKFARLPVEEAGAILAVTADALPENVRFENNCADRDDKNNFVGSALMNDMLTWLHQRKSIFLACVARPVDLTTMDGMTDYGMPSVLVRPLTVEEYRRNRAYIPLASRSWWTATGCTASRSPYSDTNLAYSVSSDGTLDRIDIYYAYFAPRPALYLQSSILVSVEDGEEEKGLSGYTELDLLAELQRREQKCGTENT